MANTIGEKELRTDYPNVSGLVAGTTKQEGRNPKLDIQEEDKTTIDDNLGLDNGW